MLSATCGSASVATQLLKSFYRISVKDPEVQDDIIIINYSFNENPTVLSFSCIGLEPW